MAKSNALGDVIIDLEARDVSLTRGLTTLETKLKGAERSLKGFDRISRVAFGVGLGTAAFNLAHEGLTTLIGGFTEAAAANMSFGDSVANGIEKLLGMETRLAAATKRTEEFKNAQHQLVAAIYQAAQAQRTAQGYRPVSRFSALGGNAAQAQASLAALQAAARDADAAAAPGRAAIAAARQRIATIESQPVRKDTQRDRANVLALARDELAALESQWAASLQLAAKAEAQWKAELATFERTNVAAKAAAAEVDMYAAAMEDAERATEKWRVAEERQIAERQKWAAQAEQNADDYMAAMADARKEEEARAQAIIEGLDPLHQFKQTLSEIESLADMGLIDRSQRDAAAEQAASQFDIAKSPRRGGQLLGFEELARNMQMSVGGDKLTKNSDKQVELQTKANQLLQDIKSKPVAAVLQ